MEENACNRGRDRAGTEARRGETVMRRVVISGPGVAVYEFTQAAGKDAPGGGGGGAPCRKIHVALRATLKGGKKETLPHLRVSGGGGRS